MLAEAEVAAEVRVQAGEALDGVPEEVGLVAVGGGGQAKDGVRGGEQDPGDLHGHVGGFRVAAGAFDPGTALARGDGMAGELLPGGVEGGEVGVLPGFEGSGDEDRGREVEEGAEGLCETASGKRGRGGGSRREAEVTAEDVGGIMGLAGRQETLDVQAERNRP